MALDPAKIAYTKATWLRLFSDGVLVMSEEHIKLGTDGRRRRRLNDCSSTHTVASRWYKLILTSLILQVVWLLMVMMLMLLVKLVVVDPSY